MSILKNSIESIQIGIEDYENGDHRRSVSAVRNISAGILLLYKEKLCRLSPTHDGELLIRQNIRPIKDENGDIQFEGKGKKTVDVQSIRERFASLEVYVDWGRFDEINRLRNDLEHYYTSQSPDAVREIISKSFILIRDFLVNELLEDPQQLIGGDCWASMLGINDVYTAEKNSCAESLDSVDWVYNTVEHSLKHLRCTDCHSPLIEAPAEDDSFPLINLRCRSCSNEFNFNDVLEQCIDDCLAMEAYRAIKDGGESPYDTCIGCSKDTFIHEEKCCVACGYEMEYEECEMCGERLTLEEQWNEGKCSYCQYKWEKIMAE